MFIGTATAYPRASFVLGAWLIAAMKTDNVEETVATLLVAIVACMEQRLTHGETSVAVSPRDAPPARSPRIKQHDLGAYRLPPWES